MTNTMILPRISAFAIAMFAFVVTPCKAQRLLIYDSAFQYVLDDGSLNIIPTPPPTVHSNPPSQSTALSVAQTGQFSGVSGNIEASASYGRLRARTTTSAYNVTGSWNGEASGSAIARLKFDDDLLVTSTALPANTPVTIRFNMAGSGYLSITQGQSQQPTTSQFGHAYALADLEVVSAQGVALGFQRYYRSTAEAPVNDPAFVVNTHVGARISISGTLTSYAFVNPHLVADIFNAASEYFNSANVFADPVTPDVSLVSNSGHNYGSAVVVSGVIDLQENVNNLQPIQFDFRPVNGSAGFAKTITLNSDRTYSLSDIPRESYIVSIKGTKWLRKNITVDARFGNVSNANATLLAGDANNDNFADIADLLLLIAHYNQVSPNAGFSDAADLNCDGVNDITDLLLLVANYNKQGDS